LIDLVCDLAQQAEPCKLNKRYWCNSNNCRKSDSWCKCEHTTI